LNIKPFIQEGAIGMRKDRSFYRQRKEQDTPGRRVREKR
jgi:hypothetical protein